MLRAEHRNSFAKSVEDNKENANFLQGGGWIRGGGGGGGGGENTECLKDGQGKGVDQGNNSCRLLKTAKREQKSSSENRNGR